MKRFYVLRDGSPIATDVLAWADWFASSHAERSLAVTKLSDRGDVHTRISTCFLGVANDYTADNFPILWETAVFYATPDRDGHDVDIKGRYASRLDAIAGHHRVVAEVVEHIAASLGRRPEVLDSSQETTP